VPQVKVPFEVTGWEPEPLELGEPGAVTFGRVTLRKTFSGPLTGTSVVAMTSAAVGEAPVGYVAVELVTGTLDGRTGGFVLQHTGVVDDGAPDPSGVVLPGTGKASLQGPAPSARGVGGRGVLSLTLDYELP
jgi:hypothetical protein